MQRCIGSFAALIVGALFAQFLRFKEMSRSCKEIANALRKPFRRWFFRSRKGDPVDGDDAELGSIAERPFEVIEERPLEVAPNVVALVEQSVESLQRFVEIANA